MESKKISFKIICNGDEYLSQSIDWYNQTYNTNFEIVNIDYDEVTFIEIEVSKYKISDIFNLGHIYGVKEENLRSQGLIDW